LSVDIRRWSEELARLPSSRIFLPLGNALRLADELDLALRVATRAIQRHAHDADAFDLAARIQADRGELNGATEYWERALHLSPAHSGARRGLGFCLFRAGRFEEAERVLAAVRGDDAAVSAALQLVRRQLGRGTDLNDVEPRLPDVDSGSSITAPTASDQPIAAPRASDHTVGADPPAQSSRPDDARSIFADVAGDAGSAVLLLDCDGLVLAGSCLPIDGRDVSQKVGAELSGVRDEADRTSQLLAFGAWSAVAIETESTTVAMCPVGDDNLLIIAAPRSMPLGLVHRLMIRCRERARLWLEGQS